MKKSVIVPAAEAVKKSQEVNRENWLKAAGAKVSEDILKAAGTGVRELSVNFKDLIVGAENLEEAGEMLTFINKELATNGYKNVIEKNGILHITW